MHICTGLDGRGQQRRGSCQSDSEEEEEEAGQEDRECCDIWMSKKGETLAAPQN